MSPEGIPGEFMLSGIQKQPVKKRVGPQLFAGQLIFLLTFFSHHLIFTGF
jgi:hypothetical protein